MGLVNVWQCPRCRTVYKGRATRTVLCTCTPVVTPMRLCDSYDDGVTDCGSYQLRVVPSWG